MPVDEGKNMPRWLLRAALKLEHRVILIGYAAYKDVKVINIRIGASAL